MYLLGVRGCDGANLGLTWDSDILLVVIMYCTSDPDMLRCLFGASGTPHMSLYHPLSREV